MANISGPYITGKTPVKVPLRQNFEAREGRREEELKERVDFGHSVRQPRERERAERHGKTCKKGRNTGGAKEGKQ